jgi:hypothetical protein
VVVKDTERADRTSPIAGRHSGRVIAAVGVLQNHKERLMAASTATPTRTSATTNHGPVRRTTETKAAFKTTELIAYIVAVVGVLIAAAMVDESNAGGFGSKQAWLYVTILTVGYMISRGLAKSGSRDPYTDDSHDNNR